MPTFLFCRSFYFYLNDRHGGSSGSKKISHWLSWKTMQELFPQNCLVNTSTWMIDTLRITGNCCTVNSSVENDNKQIDYQLTLLKLSALIFKNWSSKTILYNLSSYLYDIVEVMRTLRNLISELRSSICSWTAAALVPPAIWYCSTLCS